MWDTAGQERFRSVSQAYFRNSDACIAVYDITKRSSFENLETQINNFLTYSVSSGGYRCAGPFGNNQRDFHQSNSERLKNIVLVGTKSDLLREKEREVTFKEAVEFEN